MGVLESRLGKFRGSPNVARTRKARLLVVFGVVGVIVLTVMLLSLGNGTKETDKGAIGVPTTARTPSSPSMTASPAEADANVEADALVEADAVTYAIAEVTSGRAGDAGMDNDGAGVIDGAVSGRVVSRNGDIVLVEVSMAKADTKTFATLLLQKTEGGWRTRDVFDDGR